MKDHRTPFTIRVDGCSVFIETQQHERVHECESDEAAQRFAEHITEILLDAIGTERRRCSDVAAIAAEKTGDAEAWRTAFVISVGATPEESAFHRQKYRGSA